MLRGAAQSDFSATYVRSVSVALLLSASARAAAPASPKRLYDRLRRGEEGQCCEPPPRAMRARLA